MTDDEPTPPAADGAPVALLLAAGLVGVQGLVMVALVVLEVAELRPGRTSAGLPVAVFFGVYGVLLLGAALALARRRAWARGPVLATQLLELGVAWSSRDDVLLALALGISALVAALALVHPTSIEALERDRRADPDS